MLRPVALLLVTLVLAGCARHGTASDGVADSAVITTAITTTTPAPVSVPPEGACRREVHVQTPAPPPPPGAATGGATPVAAHNAENNGWKVRKQLPAEDREAGVAAVGKIENPLQALCDKGFFSFDATRDVLRGAGFDDVFIVELRASPGEAAPPGNAFYFQVKRACVFGEVKPGAVRLDVDGTTGEGSCYEPPSH
ncbi:hypothetical protein FKR81_05380 [Lentzea tibetensis]|uniref:Lipoprotein n=1 Tax=Lentzea tibetensis TaxID=2591470 RepID=A0A563F090_9PSEU|nr:hypothetical protein [Lentzea tibetensis]TWP53395.1 hypothetical protein FKR81_05380 [Lentzea tibetensis]